MFIDSRTLRSGSLIESDVCIVGAGAAGITIAREFIGKPFRVCLVESGGLEPDQDTQALYSGKIVGFPYYPLDLIRLRYFGGTTNHWAGACRPLDKIDLERRPVFPYSGWPLEKSQLDPYYQRAHVYCQLGPYNYDPDLWASKDDPALPIGDTRITTAILQDSPPTRFGPVFHDEIAQADNISTYLFANVTEIETSAPADAVTRLNIATLQGNRFAIRARFFIIATGAVENARLLLASNKTRPDGLGNEHDLVGRFFMEHLSVTGGLFLPSSTLPDAALGLYTRGGEIDGVGGLAYLTIEPETLRHEKLLNVRAFLKRTSLEVAQQGASGWSVSIQGMMEALQTGNLDFDFASHLGNVIDNTDEIAIRTYETFFNKPEGVYALFYHIENAPHPDSRVTLMDERDSLGMPRVQLDWRFGDPERETLRRANAILGEELGRLGLGRVSTVPDDPETGWPPGVRGAWHQMGTTRMHPDPKQGVVDENARVHGLSNLYIAGSSVFPTSGYTNPTLTIVALSLRLSDHISRLMS